MLDNTLVVKGEGALNAYAVLFREEPKFVRRAVNDVVEDVSDEVIRMLSVEPGPVKTPIQWTSEKQRKAYFASNGFGHGIPYKRTHKLARSWHIQVNFIANQISQIRIYNDADSMVFVEGEFQQRFHAITGWLNAETTLEKADRMLQADVSKRLVQLFDEVG